MDEIKNIVQLVLNSPVYDFSLEYRDVKLSFKKDSGQAVPASSAVTPAPGSPATGVEIAAAEQEQPAEPELLKEIVSSVVGTFYASAEPDAPPLVRVGDRITVNSVIGIVEAMKMYNDIIADTEGEVVDILVENGQLIQFGQPLFLVRTT